MKTFLLFDFLLLSFLSFSQPRYLVPYRDGKLWGYADTNLNIIIPPKYDVADCFSFGRAIIQKGNYFGALNSRGEEIILPQYDKLSDFYYQYVIATKQDSSGLIEMPSGKFLLPPVYKKINRFNDPFFIVEGKNSLSGVLDAKSRKWLLPLKYSIELHQFPWFVAKRKGSIIYFTAENGKFVTGSPPKIEKEKKDLDDTPPPVEKLETTGSHPQYHVGPVYDRTIFPKEMQWIRIVTKNGKTGVYSDEKYKEIVPLIYDTIEAVSSVSFKEFFIASKNGKVGVINGENKEIVPFVYDQIKYMDSSASLGFYIVKQNGKYGITKNDELLVPCKYDNASHWDWIRNGFALYKDKKQGMYIYRRQDSLPNILIEPKYDIVWSMKVLHPNDFDVALPYQQNYYHGKVIIMVTENQKRGYIDLKGNEFFRD